MIHARTANHATLQTRAADLVTALGGVWRAHGSMCRCPAHADHTPSLSVRVGARTLLLKCFAGCPTTDILRALRRLDLKVPVCAIPQTVDGEESACDSCALARALWERADPLAGTQGAAYLAARAIHVASPALRFLARTPLGKGRLVRFRPAIIAAVREGRAVVAVQRLFLEPGRPMLAADLDNPRLTLGRPRTGAVRLQPAGDVLGLAEGIETALSASQLLGLPVWATLGNERLPGIALPPAVQRLLLLPDNDAAGRRAETLARARYRDAVGAIETLWPWYGLNDWNDVLRRGGKEVGGGARRRI